MEPDEIRTFTVTASAEGLRLDVWLAEQLGPDASRSLVQRWLAGGAIAGPAPLQSSKRVRSGETYQLTVPRPAPLSLAGVDVGLRFIYEDNHLAVLHKPAGVSVHPAPGDDRPSVIHGLLHAWRSGWLTEFEAESEQGFRPGIVHRLDRETEGLLVVARKASAGRKLARQFALRTVFKQYRAWLMGAPRNPVGRLEAALARHPVDRRRMRIDPAGRHAISEYEALQSVLSRRGRKYCEALVQILTGRTHQIRVHMAHLGAPVVGDLLYSRSAREFARYGMLLFAERLEFDHPESGERLKFRLEPPERFREFERRAVNL